MDVKDDYAPTGWESVEIQHNEDGTISFASSADEKSLQLKHILTNMITTKNIQNLVLAQNTI